MVPKWKNTLFRCPKSHSGTFIPSKNQFYRGVSFKTPPSVKTRRPRFGWDFEKIKPRDQNFAETLKKIKKLRAKRAKKLGVLAIYRGKTWTNSKIAREAREKNRVLDRIQRENVKKSWNCARSARKKMDFLAVYRGETLKTMKKRPPKAAENFYKNKTPHIQIGWDFEKWNPRT